MKNKNNQIPMSSSSLASASLRAKVEKANLLKINQNNNNFVNYNKFNAKTETVNYFNNKLIKENSQFLNKNNSNKEKVELNNLNLKNKSLSSMALNITLSPEMSKESLKSKKIIKTTPSPQLGSHSPSHSPEGEGGEGVESKGIPPILRVKFFNLDVKKEHEFLTESNLNGQKEQILDTVSPLTNSSVPYLTSVSTPTEVVSSLKLKILNFTSNRINQFNKGNKLDFSIPYLGKNSKVDLNIFKLNKGIIFNTKVKQNIPQYLNEINNPLSTFVSPILPLQGIHFKEEGLLKREENNTLIHKYLNYIGKSNNIINTNPNLSKKYGILLKYNRNIGFNFINKIKGNNNIKLISEFKEETYKLLFYFFKSIFCLISKPTILFSPDKITIRLFYYLIIPKKKILKFFAIHNLNSFRNKWLLKNLNREKYSLINSSNLPLSNIRLPFMRLKVRKAISRLKSKPNLVRKAYFYLRQFNLVKVYHNKFLVLTNILSRLFNKPVILEITRIHNFKFDSNILANAIQLVVKNKQKSPRVAIKNVYKKKNIKILNDPNLKAPNNIISFLSGLNIYINGRLMREAIIPRMTTKKYEKGATATGKVNYIDTSSITKKNRKGAYTIKVKSAQNFF